MIIPDVKKMAGMIVGRIKPNGDMDGGEQKPESQMDEKSMGLHAAAEDLINAIHSKSAMDVADALKSAFMQMDVDDGEDGEAEAPEA